MTDAHKKLIKELRIHAFLYDSKLADETANAIEELSEDYEVLYEKHVDLLRAAKRMHTWIFLNTVDEQKSYDECGLSEDMNISLGYGGQIEFRAKRPEDEP